MATRIEKVIVDVSVRGDRDLIDLARAAASADKSLAGLGDTDLQPLSRDIDGLGDSTRNLDRAGADLDRFTGRLRVLAEVGASFGAGAIPLGAVSVGGLAGLVSTLGLATAGAGVFAASMQGVGDALKAVNKAAIDPSEANIESANEALGQLSETSRAFVYELREISPALKAVRDAGSEALIPGLTESLDNFETFLPRLESVMTGVGGAVGNIAVDVSESFASERWQPFLDFIETEAPPALLQLSDTIGSLTHGLSELWMAFTPLNRDFSAWMVDAAAGFDEWATSLSRTEGFAEFVEYVRTSGPQVAATLGAVSVALLDIVQAAAPIAGPVLQVIEAMASAISAIADSDIGTPLIAAVAALSAFNRTAAVTASLTGAAGGAGLFGPLVTTSKKARASVSSFRTDVSAMADTLVPFGANMDRAAAASDRMRNRLATVGKSAGVLGGLAVASTGAADGLGLTNTMSLALMGTMGGPWGAAVGGAVGLALDFAESQSQTAVNVAGLTETLNQQTGAVTTNSREWAKNALFDAGVLQAAQRLGWDLSVVTDAALGSADAMAMVTDRIEQFNAPFENLPMNDPTGAKVAEDMALIREVLGDTNGALAEGREKIALFAEAGEGAADSSRHLSVNARRLTDSLGVSAEGFLTSRDAMAAWRQQIGETAQKFVGLGDALNDSKVSLQGWIKQLEEQAAALRNFRLNAERAAERGLRQGLIAALREAGPEGALRMKQLANATESEIGRANRAWQSGQREVNRYVDSVTRIPKSVTTTVSTETARAMAEINALEARLNRIADEDVFVNVRHTTTYSKRGLGPVGGVADGGTIRGPRWPYGDKVLTMLAPGEEVVSNRYGQADRNRDLLKAINAGRYADGGTVARRSIPSPSVSIPAPQFPSRLILETDIGPLMLRVADDAAVGVVEAYRAHASARASAQVYDGRVE